MKLTSFYSAISAVICLFCLAGTVRGADLSPNTPDIERNKISAVAIEVSPSANDTFRITAKHAWKMTPGVYRKGHFQEVSITDKDASDFILYFFLTNRQEENVKNLIYQKDFENYLLSTTKGLLSGAREKEVKLFDFSPAGMPGCMTVLHSKEGRNPANHAFPVVEAGVCRISEQVILTFVLQRKIELAPETRIDLYKLLVSLGKEEIADQRENRSVLASTGQVWNAAVEKFRLKLGMEEFSKQYPFTIELKNNHWIIAGQPVLPDAKKSILILKLSAKDGYEVQAAGEK